MIYVDRPNEERELERAIRGTLHTVIYGDSGNGKSWLYKKVLKNIDAYSVSANCGNVARFQSVTNEVHNVVFEAGTRIAKGSTEKKAAEVSAVVAKGTLESTTEYDIKQQDALLAAFAELRRKAGVRPAVLVLDNLEAIFHDTTLMDEIANIIILLDDIRYAQHHVKILIVGTPQHIVEYFSKTRNLSTVGSRLQEITRIGGLTTEQVNQLVSKGFKELLRVEFSGDTLTTWQKHIESVTMGVAQSVQQYCEILAYLTEENDWVATVEQLEHADRAWLKGSLKQSYATLSQLMNRNAGRVGRRNQVLYALGRINRRTFRSAEVEIVLRREFPKSTQGVALGVGQILSDLVRKPNPIIKKTVRGDAYLYTDSQIKSALRVLLKKDKDEQRVIKIDFENVGGDED